MPTRSSGMDRHKANLFLENAQHFSNSTVSTESGLSYCGTVRISSTISDYFCQSTSYSTPMDAFTTYNGETDGRTYAEVVLDLSSTAGASSGAGGSAGGGFGSLTATATGSGSTAASGSSTTSSSTATGTTKSGGGGSSTPIGPIVGGVVGVSEIPCRFLPFLDVSPQVAHCASRGF